VRSAASRGGRSEASHDAAADVPDAQPEVPGSTAPPSRRGRKPKAAASGAAGGHQPEQRAESGQEQGAAAASGTKRSSSAKKQKPLDPATAAAGMLQLGEQLQAVFVGLGDSAQQAADILQEEHGISCVGRVPRSKHKYEYALPGGSRLTLTLGIAKALGLTVRSSLRSSGSALVQGLLFAAGELLDTWQLPPEAGGEQEAVALWLLDRGVWCCRGTVHANQGPQHEAQRKYTYELADGSTTTIRSVSLIAEHLAVLSKKPRLTKAQGTVHLIQQLRRHYTDGRTCTWLTQQR